MNKVVLIFVLFIGIQSFAQKELSAADSIKIKQLFFAGLREKLNENYLGANENYVQILMLDPDNAAVHYEIALINYRQNKLPEAEVSIKKAVALDSVNVWYKGLLAQLNKMKVSRPRRTAPVNAEQSDQSKSYLAIANDIRQTILVQQNYKKAIQMGDDALSLYPNQAILYYYMAFALHRDNQNMPALSNIKTALQLDGENRALQALVLSLQGEIFIDEHKFAAANDAFDKAIGLDPSNYMIVNNYVYYLALRNQDLIKAESLIAKAAKALPESSSIADTYAFVLFKLGKYELAGTWIEKAIRNDGTDNSIYLEHYGDILFLKGDVEAALMQWQKSGIAGNDSEKLKQKIRERKYIK